MGDVFFWSTVIILFLSLVHHCHSDISLYFHEIYVVTCVHFSVAIFNIYTHEASESKCTSNPLTSLLSSKSHLFPAITNTIFGGPNLCSSAIHSCRTVNDCYHQTEIERLHRQLKYNWQGSAIQTTSYKKDKKKRWAM